MVTFWGIVAALTLIGGGPAVAGLWGFERWRSRRRNRIGECAACGASWRGTPSGDPYLIHGRLVCEACATRARRRMPWSFGLLGIAAGVGTGFAVAGADVAVMMVVPAGSTVVMTLGAVKLMKLANRRAQRRIAMGEFPDMDALAPVGMGQEEEAGRLEPAV
jgi:hypothetical protein